MSAASPTVATAPPSPSLPTGGRPLRPPVGATTGAGVDHGPAGATAIATAGPGPIGATAIATAGPGPIGATAIATAGDAPAGATRPATGPSSGVEAPAPALVTASGPVPGPDEPLPAHTLADIAAGFAAATPLWSGAVRHDPDGRQPVRLIATERYEVWVIGWTTGQNVQVHDHGDSAGAFVVTEGELSEVLPGGGGGALERTLGPGRVRHLAVGVVHDVVNRAVEPATSIHVYSPPLTHMTYYDPDTFEPIGTEAVAPERTVLGPSAGSYVLHPARRPAR
jgi:mannose-6-phosphate isomerase-like protein (cupin superfamily)